MGEMDLGGWTAVPNAVLADPGLTPAAKLVLIALMSHDWLVDDGNGGKARKGVVWPSEQRLAQATGLTVRTVTRAIAALERCGYVAVERRGGGAGLRYTLRAGANMDNLSTLRRPNVDNLSTLEFGLFEGGLENGVPLGVK